MNSPGFPIVQDMVSGPGSSQKLALQFFLVGISVLSPGSSDTICKDDVSETIASEAIAPLAVKRDLCVM